MTIAKFNERALLELGMDRQTVAALRHVIAQTGNEVGARTLPYVATQAAQVPELADKTEVLDLRAALLADALCASAADVPLVSLTIPKPLAAGAMVSARIVGVTSNGNTPGTLNLWLMVGGVKVLTHAFTTPDIVGAGKGFAADFALTVRSIGNAAAGGVLSLAYNAPTVLPASASFTIPTGANTVLSLGMNWTAANAANIAMARIAYLTADKL
jgi:hypothetical protein